MGRDNKSLKRAPKGVKGRELALRRIEAAELRSDIMVNRLKTSCIGQEILRIPDRKLPPI